jgi:hypothetical protein
VTGIATNNPITEKARIFSDPSYGFLFIKVNDPLILPLKVTFYDPLGKQILVKKVTDIESKIDISCLISPGLVFYQLKGSNGFSGSGKILVQIK